MHCSLTLPKAFASLSVALCKGTRLLLLPSVCICYTTRSAYSVSQFIVKRFHCLLCSSLIQLLYTGIKHCYSKPVLQNCWKDVLHFHYRALTHGLTALLNTCSTCFLQRYGHSYCCWWSEFVLCSVCSLGAASVV
jgi:hypothetical protein